MPFKKVDPKQSLPKMEEGILKFWEENKIFEKSVEKNSADKSFVFYEGPPTANGEPGLHHVLARAFKDVIPRYKTMKGFRVERKAGWDTHGLPVEIQVEKELKIRNKTEIENIIPGDPRKSIIEFNKKCKESTWKYKDLWEKLTRRMAYWVDMKNPYITYENRYIESVWWVIAQIFKTKNEKGENLVYKGHKVVPYCYRCGTTLSSHEVAQGYQTVKDDSIFVKFKVKGEENTYLLSWTTTPWTLPGNVALAVGENINYLKLRVKNLEDNSEEIFLVAEKRSGIIAEKYGFEAESNAWKNLLSGRTNSLTNIQKPRFQIDSLDSYTGKKLVGMKYDPLFLKELAESVVTKTESDQLIEPQLAIRDTGDNLFEERCKEIIKDGYEIDKLKENSYKVYTARFVSAEEGTGIVHIAPAFGEDDANLARDKELPTLHTVSREGVLRKNLGLPGEGIPVKKKDDKGKYKTDQLIVEDLKKRNLLFKEELYEHEYPFCWRCDTPLIYYAKPSWFIRMSELCDELVKNNENINWIPENIKNGRFGEWLRDIKDWAISRERYWGTPLPIWECQRCGELKVVESIKELEELSGQKLEDLHKPYIDDVKFKCSCGGEMARTPEVMDVWFDSGSMPLAQFYYPNQATKEDKEKIKSGKYFPADYISEAIDQTRGWFYTLHAIATLLNVAGKVPAGNAYKNVICLGHILDAKGKKMSKSKGNVIDPMEVMDKYGADMLRWMLFTINQPGLPKRFDIKGMNDIMNRIFRMLWNSYSFFTMYAIIDKWKSKGENKSKNLLDKWIISELNMLIKEVDGKLNAYDIYSSAKLIEKFIDNLSNWYIRRSRKRFWKSENDEDKNKAYQTLYAVLIELSKLMAPFTPFVAEEIYKNLTGKESVHLADFPVADEKLIDEKLNEEMKQIRIIISEALQLRANAGIKVRQPLSKLQITNYELRDKLINIVREEVNVKEIKLIKGENFNIELNTEISEELKLEGQAREIIRHIQEMRKKAGYEVDNRIKVGYTGALKVFDKFGEVIAREVLADELITGEIENADLEKGFEIENEEIKISIKRRVL